MKKIKHSKFRNTALIFELLSRQITVDILDDSKSKALSILKNFYNSKTNLNEELMLYNFLRKKNLSSESKSNYYIDSIIKSRLKLDEKQLRHEKYKLIKEIKEFYNINDFFRTKIPDYKVTASIYKLFEFSVNSQINYNPIDSVQSRYVLIENMTSPLKKNSYNSNVAKAVRNYKKQDKEIKSLSYKILIENFNKKYGKLDRNQRKLLKKYVDNLSNTNQLREYVNFEIPKIKKILKVYSSRIVDRVTQIKLNEVCNQICQLKKGKIVKDNQLVTMLKLYELIRETKKEINKSEPRLYKVK